MPLQRLPIPAQLTRSIYAPLFALADRTLESTASHQSPKSSPLGGPMGMDRSNAMNRAASKGGHAGSHLFTTHRSSHGSLQLPRSASGCLSPPFQRLQLLARAP